MGLMVKAVWLLSGNGLNRSCEMNGDVTLLRKPSFMLGRKALPFPDGPFAAETEKPARGFLDDQFLIAMPGMKDDRFARAVIYVCAHSEEGRDGPDHQPGPADALSRSSGAARHHERAGGDPAAVARRATSSCAMAARSTAAAASSCIRTIITVESSMPVSDEICLTATVDILRAISAGRGPRQALMALGYSGWGAGQLESEIAANGWLTCPADADLLFDADIDRKYDRILALDRRRSRASQPHAPVTPERRDTAPSASSAPRRPTSARRT